MPEKPYFNFFPADWLSDAGLRRCSLAARGLWIDLICLLHQCPNRGVLADSAGRPWLDHEIAGAVGGDPTAVGEALRELLSKGVAGRDQLGAIFCRRMVREQDVSSKRREAGRLGADAKYGKHVGKSLANSVAKRKQKPSSSFSSLFGEEPPDREEPGQEGLNHSPNPSVSSLKLTTSEIQAVVAHYRRHHPRAAPLKPTSKEWKLIQTRLSEGFTVQDLCDAIDGNHRSPFHCGENDRGTKYHGLELIFRDASKVQTFVELATNRPAPVLSATNQKNQRAAEQFLARHGVGTEADHHGD